MTKTRNLMLGLGFALAVTLSASCGSPAAEPVPTPTPRPTQPAVAQTASTAIPASAAIAESIATEVPATVVPVAADVPTTVPIKSARTGDEKLAPELTELDGWINSEPFTLEDSVGKVVLVDFWTYTCVNCIRTFPYLKAWDQKYADKGLVILGVHAPEFEFEELHENVLDAVQAFGIKYAVAQDNNMGTWRAFENRFWPAKYLIDADGFIRYTHFGEGNYSETERVIRELLLESGANLDAVSGETLPEPEIDLSAVPSRGSSEGQTRELYGGYSRNYNALVSRASPPYIVHEEYYDGSGREILFEDPGEHMNHFIYLNGLWKNRMESIVHARETTEYEDYIAVKFYATSVNAVMDPENSGSVRVRLTIDDAPVDPDHAGVDVMFDADGSSYVLVDKSRMYNLVNAPRFDGHELRLSSNSQGFSLFAFTFGSYKGGEPGE